MSSAAVRVRGADITDDAFVRCRTYNHAWDEFAPLDLQPPWYGWRLSLRCIRCATERHDNYDFKGQIMGRRYLYPDGYQTKGDDRPTKQEFREELFVRLRKQLEQHHAVGGEIPDLVEMPDVTSIKSARKATATTTKKTTRKRA
jgi:hypothetical protein